MKAFTLIELIFVIVIVGIMSAIGMTSFKPHYLMDDVNFIKSKIKKAQFLGIGYEHNSFGNEESNPDYNNGCIKIDKSSLDEDSNNTNQISYHLHVDITVANSGSDIICFDSKGRPHTDNFKKTNLITKQKIFQFKYKNEERNITIEPITGFTFISF